MEMSLDSMINATLSMRSQSVREQFSYGVVKMAMDQMEQTGTEIIDLLDDAPVSLDPNLGNLIDISL